MPGRSKLRRALILLLLAAALLALYAYFIEPHWIEVARHNIAAPPATLTSPLKIAHLTDLHTSGLGRRERALLAHLEAERPDVIVISGDTIADSGAYDATRELLSRLRAPLGVWLVRGNWENWRPAAGERRHYAQAGVRLLLNSNAQLRPDVWIFGLDDPASGLPDLPAATASMPHGPLAVALFHAPAFFDRLNGEAHLAFSGHTHGGQVRIPLLPPLWLPRGSGRYVAGWYENAGARMYVSRGIGTSILPLRFACRPELAIITIHP